MTTEFKPGDTVRYRASFLKSIGWHTDVPDNGVVREIAHNGICTVALIQWPDGDANKCQVNNLVLASESHLEPV